LYSNGISAFGVDKKRLIAESIRVTKNNGIILFSSYSTRYGRIALIGLENKLKRVFWEK